MARVTSPTSTKSLVPDHPMLCLPLHALLNPSSHALNISHCCSTVTSPASPVEEGGGRKNDGMPELYGSVGGREAQDPGVSARAPPLLGSSDPRCVIFILSFLFSENLKERESDSIWVQVFIDQLNERNKRVASFLIFFFLPGVWQRSRGASSSCRCRGSRRSAIPSGRPWTVLCWRNSSL